MGYNINVDSRSGQRTTDTDTVLDISGEGAADFHAYCTGLSFNPEALENGTFTIKGTNINWNALPDPTTANHLFGLLRRAANERER